MKISVVIPTLNEEKYLEHTLKSLKNQTFRDYEIIVSDGVSTDDTVRIARKYADHVIVEKGNVCLGRDLGLRMAKGEIIVGADGDTVYPETYLQDVWDIFQNHPKIVGLCGPVTFINPPLWASAYMQTSRFVIELVYRLTGRVIYAFALNLAYPRDVLLEIGGYNTSLDFGGDEMDIISRLQKKGKLLYEPKLMVTSDSRRFRVGIFKYTTKYLLFGYMLNYVSRKYFKLSFITSEPVR